MADEEDEEVDKIEANMQGGGNRQSGLKRSKYGARRYLTQWTKQR
jgi:hypothetical protein